MILTQFLYSQKIEEIDKLYLGTWISCRTETRCPTYPEISYEKYTTVSIFEISKKKSEIHFAFGDDSYCEEGCRNKTLKDAMKDDDLVVEYKGYFKNKTLMVSSGDDEVPLVMIDKNTIWGPDGDGRLIKYKRYK